jgi:hypothetical protein
MIDRDKLEYFTMAAWLRGYAEGNDQNDMVSPAITKKIKRAAEMLDFVFNNEVNHGGSDDTQQEW